MDADAKDAAGSEGPPSPTLLGPPTPTPSVFDPVIDPATPPPEPEEAAGPGPSSEAQAALSPPRHRAALLLERAREIGCGLARRAVTAVLRAGPIPAHVAFIMDGNRRFAEGMAAPISAGHEAGYHKLIDALDWCLALGVRTVSVFAFSVDNFRRPAAEVSDLMRLAADRLSSLASPGGDGAALLARHGARVRVLGDRSLLPPFVAAAADAAEASTAARAGEGAGGGVKTLNICLAYAARVELAAAVDGAAAEVAAAAGRRGGGGLPTRPASLPALLDRHLYTAGAPPVDLLVRSSGEARLSDFLTWQARGAALAWARPLWPDLRFADVARAVAAYQRASPALAAVRVAAGVDAPVCAADAGSGGGGGGGAAPPPPPPPPPAAEPAAAAEAAAAPPPHPPPPPPPTRAPVGVPRRVRRGGATGAGGGPGGAGGGAADAAMAWAARPAVPPPPVRLPRRRGDGGGDDDDDDEDDAFDPDDPTHRFDPQCPCCLPGVNRRRAVAVSAGDGVSLAEATRRAAVEAATQPAGLEDVFAAKKAREAAVRAEMERQRAAAAGEGSA